MPSRFNHQIEKKIKIRDVHNLENRLSLLNHLDTQLTTETADRTAADDDLDAKITTETADRIAADAALESKIETNTNELFLNDTDGLPIFGSWNSVTSYGSVSSSAQGVVNLTSTTTSDAGIHNSTPIDILRNNVNISIKALTDRGQMVILSLSDIPFTKNLNKTNNWPWPDYGKGIVMPIQHSTNPVSAYNWVRSSELPNTTILHDNNRATLYKDESLFITITDGTLTFNRVNADNNQLTELKFTSTITLPLTKYYIGLHIQSGDTSTCSYKLTYGETTRNPPYSLINELSSELLTPTQTRYVIEPGLNNVDSPYFYCDENVRYVIANPANTFTLVLPTPNTTKDFVFTIKNIANQTFTVQLPPGYVWGNTYSTNTHALASHRTVDILFNPRGLLGDWANITSLGPIKLCHILHETTTINNP